MPYVYTNPNKDALVFKDDVVFVLSNKKPGERLRSASFAWAEAANKDRNRYAKQATISEHLLAHSNPIDNKFDGTDTDAVDILMEVKKTLATKMKEMSKQIREMGNRLEHLEKKKKDEGNIKKNSQRKKTVLDISMSIMNEP